jgi:hypothetical protein
MVPSEVDAVATAAEPAADEPDVAADEPGEALEPAAAVVVLTEAGALLPVAVVSEPFEQPATRNSAVAPRADALTRREVRGVEDEFMTGDTARPG